MKVLFSLLVKRLCIVANINRFYAAGVVAVPIMSSFASSRIFLTHSSTRMITLPSYEKTITIPKYLWILPWVTVNGESFPYFLLKC